MKFIIIPIVLCTLGCTSAIWKDFEQSTLKDLVNITNSGLVGFNLRAKRINRSTYGITGTVTIYDDNLHDYEAEVETQYSKEGNEPYVTSPLKILRDNVCTKLNKEYRKFIMNDLKKTSDLPWSDDESENLCEKFEKKTYNVKDFIFNSKNVPSFLQAGWYKIIIYIYKNKGQDCVSGVESNLRLY